MLLRDKWPIYRSALSHKKETDYRHNLPQAECKKRYFCVRWWLVCMQQCANIMCVYVCVNPRFIRSFELGCMYFSVFVVYTYTYTHARTRIQIKFTSIHTYIHTYRLCRRHTHTHTHTRINTHTHTHTHTRYIQLR